MMKLKVKDADAFFCFIPAMVGILMILFTIGIAFKENADIYNEASLVFFWVFLGLVLISHNLLSFYSVNSCKKEVEIKKCSLYTNRKADNTMREVF